MKHALRRSPLQAGLTIGPANDRFEREADHVADQVMRMSGVQVRTTSSPSELQRRCSECEEELRAKPESGGTKPAATVPPIVHQALRSPGTPLDAGTRAFFEPRFGRDFGDVRVHADATAAASARAVNARAYTIGSDVVFAPGRYSPHSFSGRSLLAHELTHVLQQSTATSPAATRLQRLTLDPVDSMEQGDCGFVGMHWQFNLSSPASGPGYFVQRVDVHEKIENCPSDVKSTPAMPTSQYWEAWDVNKGETTESIGSPNFTDYAWRRPPGDSSGTYAQVGYVKFFLRSVTGDLGTFDTAPSDPGSSWRPGRKGGVAMAGGLPSTSTKPSWWDSSPVEGPRQRWISSWWNCCGEEANQFSRVDAYPK